MGQVHLFEKIMIVLGSRGQFYHHRYTYLIPHNGVYLHAAFLLSAFRMSTYSLKNVSKERDCGSIHHIQLLLPGFLTAHRAAVQ